MTNIGICHRRVQEGKPAFFVNYQNEDGNQYEYFQFRFMAEDFKNKLNSYPFVVRGPTDKLKKVEAVDYTQALNKVLATNPNKFIITTYAMNTAGYKHDKILERLAKGVVEFLIPIKKKIYFKPTNTMDLQTARKQAAADSKAQKKKIYVNLDDEMECILSSIPSADPENVMAAFVNGAEVELELPKAMQAKTTKTNAALSSASKKITKTKFSITKNAEEAQTMAKKTESKKVVTKAAPEKAAKAAPKVAAKKVEAKAPKAKGEPTVPRGNNMFLTAKEWEQVDKKRGDVSFSAWARGLVKKAAGIAE